MADTKETVKEIVFVNHILDNVHGFIGLTDLENKIEMLPIFKRLQDISQLGLVKRIFPCALHNRYIHSLGVMHIIDQMALHLNIFNSAERQLLRLAGMLHDLGHYPLSHDLEQVYDIEKNVLRKENTPLKEIFSVEAAESVNKIMQVEPMVEEEPIPVDKIQKPKRKLIVKGPFHHESVTAKVIRSSTSIRAIIVEGIKEGTFDEIGRSPSKFSDDEMEDFATRIISDIGLLLQNLAVKECTIGEEHAWIVGVKEKGIGCADQYMMNRYLAYTQVIFHKYTSIIGKMLREVVLWMMNQPGFDFYDQDTVKKIVEQHETTGYYLAFTDSYFFNRLNAINKGVDGCPDDVYYFVEQLKNFRSLDVKAEDVFAGDTQHQKEHIEKTECYKYILDLEKRHAFEYVNGLYLFDNKKLTDHVPFHIFEKNFRAYNETHQERLSEEELSRGELPKAELSFEKYQIDRLMDGLAVISDDEDELPFLLLDAPRSIMTEIYDMRQLMFREYRGE